MEGWLQRESNSEETTGEEKVPTVKVKLVNTHYENSDISCDTDSSGLTKEI